MNPRTLLSRPIATVGLLLLSASIAGCAPRTATVTTPQARVQLEPAPAPPAERPAEPALADPVCVLGPVDDEPPDDEITDEEALAAIAASSGQPTTDLFGPPPAVAAAPAGQLRRVQGVTTARFGEGLFGFVEWISADARLIALRTFAYPPRITHHGGDGLHARLVLVDTTTGKREYPDDVVAEDPRGRYIVVRAGKRLWLIDSETGERNDLAARGADLENDDNACLPPRHALFDATGTHVLFIRKGPGRLVQRDLQSGVETEIAAGPGRLWAAISEGPDEHPLLIVVPKDSDGDRKITLPRQRTTCKCRWCGRFALMSSSHGFDGDAFKFVAVDGARRVDVASPGTPLGADVFAEDGRGPLTRADGSPYPLPQGCQQPQVVRGSPAVLLTCDTRGGVLWPATGKLAELPDPVRALKNAAARRHDGRRLVGATLGGDEAQQFVTVDLEHGTSTPGPKITGLGAADRRGHVLACDADGVVGHDTLGGATRRLAGPAIVTDSPGLAHLGGRLHAVDVTRGLAHALPGAALAKDARNNFAWRSAVPAAVAENGCVLLRAGAGDAVDVGPWTVQCPGPDPAP